MAQQTLNELYEIIKNRKAQPKEGSYTNYLFDKAKYESKYSVALPIIKNYFLYENTTDK